jgi:chorismate dehydratase
VGCVRYLNARPLIHDYPGPVRFEHPSELARDLAGGGLDAALVPVFEAFGPRRYLFVEGAAIASRGPVYSVFLARRGPLSEVRTIALDPASLTSVHLLQVLLAEFHGLRPKCLTAAGPEDEVDADARLLIGNQAIAFRQQRKSDFQYLDLGEEWTRQTGLPFVYALWLLRPDVAQPEETANDFRRLKQAGLAALDEIVEAEAARGNGFARRYLTQHIRFDLGLEEKAGIDLFRSLSHKHGFATGSPEPFVYI